MASSAVQETHLCGNCKRDIPADNFTIHEIHCRRNIGICKLCNEPIPTSDMEEHYTNEHSPVTCKCNMTVEKCALQEHEKSFCPLRLVQCQFCELEVTFNTLENHEDYCGARTEPCEKCGSSVMIKDLQDHPNVCGKVKPQKKPVAVQSWLDNREFEMPLPSSLNTRSNLTGNLYSRMPGHVPERFYGKSVLTKSLKKFDDVNKNPRREPNRGREQANPDLDMNSPLDFFDDWLEERPNTFRSSDQSRQNNRQSRREPDSSNTRNDTDFWRDIYFKNNNMKKTNVHGQSTHNYSSSNESKRINSSSTPSTDDIQLPCEFCEELFPEHDLILHQSGCRPQVSSVRRRSPSPTLNFTDNLRSSSPPANNFQSVLIPCEFCGVLMEGDILFHHQDQCDMGPNSDKTSQVSAPSFADAADSDIPPEEEYRRSRVPAASHVPGRNDAVFSRNHTRSNVDNTTRDQDRIGSLYRQMTTTRQSSLDDMRKRNIEENARMVRDQYENVFGPSRGASNRDAGSRSKPKKNINTRAEDVDKEE